MGVADSRAPLAGVVRELVGRQDSVGRVTRPQPSSAFTWKTFGVRLESTVMEFVPGERIAWNALGVGVDA